MKRLHLFIILLVSLIVTNCTTYMYKEHLDVQGLGNRYIKVTAAFTPEETTKAYRSLALINMLAPDIKYTGYEDIPLFWMHSMEFSGMTIYSKTRGTYILIDDSHVMNDKPWSYFKFGCIYAHELSHALDDTHDPQTSLLIENRLLKIAYKDPDLVSKWKP